MAQKKNRQTFEKLKREQAVREKRVRKAERKDAARIAKAGGLSLPGEVVLDETLDIGSDTRTPVDDADYQVPFRFTGTINKVSFKLGPSEVLPEDHKAAP